MTATDQSKCGTSKCKIIYVEDSDLDAQLFSFFIRKASIQQEVVHLNDGQEAVDFFMSAANQDELASCSLLVLDLGLPKLSGQEVLKRLRSTQQFKNQRIIIFSGSSSPRDREECKLLGIDEYYTKPFGLEEYEKFIRGPLMKHIAAACPQA